jgi:type IV pilus assembly protein PilC
VAAIVTAILLIKVVPVFQELFAGFGAELPAFTQFVINLSEGLQNNWYIFLVVGGGIGFGFGRGQRNAAVAFNNWIDRLSLLKLPIVRRPDLQIHHCPVCRTLSTTFAAGVPLIDALVSCAGAAGNVVYAMPSCAFVTMSPPASNWAFPCARPVFSRPWHCRWWPSVKSPAHWTPCWTRWPPTYENEVDNAVDGLTSMMEPLIMAISRRPDRRPDHRHVPANLPDGFCGRLMDS